MNYCQNCSKPVLPSDRSCGSCFRPCHNHTPLWHYAIVLVPVIVGILLVSIALIAVVKECSEICQANEDGCFQMCIRSGPAAAKRLYSK